MKIAIIGARGIGGNTYSGIEKCWTELCPRIAARGHDVHVFSEAGSNGADAFPPGVEIVRVPSIHGKYSETLSRSAISTLLAIARSYDVINFAAIGPGIFGVLPRIVRRPVVASIQGLDWQRDKWPWPARMALRLAERTIAASANEIVVVSRELEAYFKRQHRLEVTYIPNGVEFRSKPLNFEALLQSVGLEPERYIFFASRIVPEKGAHELIEAFNSVQTDLKLVISGTGRYDSAYVQGLRASDRTGRCVFTGHVSGDLLNALFHGAYLYVLPSHMEGLSLSLLEAIGCGRAVLVSDIAENLEVIGDCGFVFPVRQIPALRDRLQQLVNAPELVAQMGTNGAERAKNLLSWDAIADQYCELYTRLGQAPGRADVRPGSARA